MPMAERSIFVQLILFYAHRKAQISCFIIAIAQINQVFMTKVTKFRKIRYIAYPYPGAKNSAYPSAYRYVEIRKEYAIFCWVFSTNNFLNFGKKNSKKLC